MERVSRAGDEEYRVWVSKIPPPSLHLMPLLESVRESDREQLPSAPRSPSPPLEGVDFDALACTPDSEHSQSQLLPRLDDSSPLQIVDHTTADRLDVRDRNLWPSPSSPTSSSSPFRVRPTPASAAPRPELERRYPIAHLDSLELELRYEDRYLDLAPLGKGGFSYVRTAMKRDDLAKVCRP